MKKIFQVAFLLMLIGFLLGYTILSIRDIRRQQAESLRVHRPSPAFHDPSLGPWTFGEPAHPFFDPFQHSPALAIPKPPASKFAPVPPPDRFPVCVDPQPCAQREVRFI